ncbi:MAG: hypothetical protein Q8P86_04175 [bacterium]|nr:hypothetical protein [bacterium]
MSKNKKIIISIIIFIIIITVGFLVYIKSIGYIKLPENNFDALYQIPDTNIIFKYPSAGFYGLGIDITNSTGVKGLISGIHTEPVLEFKRDAQSAYVVLNINLIENEKDFTNIDDFAEDFKKDPGVSFYDQEYAKENGRLAEINGKEYFIYKLTEDATAWSAFAINKNGIVWVMLAYTNSFTPYSDSIYKNNDELFLNILENINFENIPLISIREDSIPLKDERLGYEMKYPLTWSIVEEREDSGMVLSQTIFQSKDYQEIESEEYKEIVAAGGETGLLQPTVMSEGVKLELLITEIPSDFRWQDWAERATDYPYGKILSERFITLEGKEVYERQVESGETTSIVISFPDPKEMKLFEFMLHTLKKDKEKNLETLKQILSTFNFLK